MGINAASPPKYTAGQNLTRAQVEDLLANDWGATQSSERSPITGGAWSLDAIRKFHEQMNSSLEYDDAGLPVRNPINFNDPYLWESRLVDGSGPAGDGGYGYRLNINPDGTASVVNADYSGGFGAQKLDQQNEFNLGGTLAKGAISGMFGVGAAPFFGPAGSYAAGMGGGAVTGGLNAGLNDQNVLKGALLGGLGGAAKVGLGDLFGGNSPVILNNGEGSLDSLYADGLGGVDTSGGFQWSPDTPSFDSGIDYDAVFGNTVGSDMSFNGNPGPVDINGFSGQSNSLEDLTGSSNYTPSYNTNLGVNGINGTTPATGAGQGFNLDTNSNGLGIGSAATTAASAGATGLGDLSLASAPTGFNYTAPPSFWDKITGAASTAGSNFLDNITTGKGALTAVGGIASLVNGINNSNTLKDAANAATAGSDPFASQRAQYQKLLSDSYTNPLGSAENQGLMQMYQQQARRQAAQAGVRANPIHQNIGMSTAMLGQLNDQRKTLANLAGAQFDPATGFKTGSDLLSNSLSARNNGYGDAFFTLAKLFGKD